MSLALIPHADLRPQVEREFRSGKYGTCVTVRSLHSAPSPHPTERHCQGVPGHAGPLLRGGAGPAAAGPHAVQQGRRGLHGVRFRPAAHRHRGPVRSRPERRCVPGVSPFIHSTLQTIIKAYLNSVLKSLECFLYMAELCIHGTYKTACALNACNHGLIVGCFTQLWSPHWFAMRYNALCAPSVCEDDNQREILAQNCSLLEENRRLQDLASSLQGKHHKVSMEVCGQLLLLLRSNALHALLPSDSRIVTLRSLMVTSFSSSLFHTHKQMHCECIRMSIMRWYVSNLVSACWILCDVSIGCWVTLLLGFVKSLNACSYAMSLYKWNPIWIKGQNTNHNFTNCCTHHWSTLKKHLTIMQSDNVYNMASIHNS